MKTVLALTLCTSLLPAFTQAADDAPLKNCSIQIRAHTETDPVVGKIKHSRPMAVPVFQSERLEELTTTFPNAPIYLGGNVQNRFSLVVRIQRQSLDQSVVTFFIADPSGLIQHQGTGEPHVSNRAELVTENWILKKGLNLLNVPLQL
ncbi:MAG: hypothetical protein EOP09_17975, partial [Proteobacteria bacterium]